MDSRIILGARGFRETRAITTNTSGATASPMPTRPGSTAGSPPSGSMKAAA